MRRKGPDKHTQNSKKAVSIRGWYPTNIILLDHPETKTKRQSTMIPFNNIKDNTTPLCTIQLVTSTGSFLQSHNFVLYLIQSELQTVEITV